MHKNTSAIIIIITNAIFIIVAVCLESQLRDKCHRYNLGLYDDFGKLLSDLGILGPHWGLDSTSQLTLLCGMPLVSLPVVFMGGKALTVQCSGSWSRLLNTISCGALSCFFTHFFLKWAGIFFFFLKNSWCKWEMETNGGRNSTDSRMGGISDLCFVTHMEDRRPSRNDVLYTAVHDANEPPWSFCAKARHLADLDCRNIEVATMV